MALPPPSHFGIEHELFVLDGDRAPAPGRTDELFRGVAAATGGTLVRAEEGHIYGVRVGTPEGEVEVKHDFATHLLEFAFPPLREPATFVGLFESWLDRVGLLLNELGLQFRPGGILSPFPAETWLSTGPGDPGGARRAFWSDAVRRPRPFARIPFNAVMASTQVNLSVPDAVAVPVLPLLYRYEYLTPLGYSTSRHAGAHCARPLIWADTLPERFPLVNIPPSLPDTVAAYQALAASAVRDYSAIAPRGQRVEFRSGCSQPDAAAILELTALRLATVASTGRGSDRSLEVSAALFMDACATGAPPGPLPDDLNVLGAALAELPSAWRPWLTRAIDRVGAGT